jgi:hypothetical protein
MSVKHKGTRFHISSGKAKALLVAVVMAAFTLGSGAADADKAKPKPKPEPAVTESVTFVYGALEVTYLDQTPGPSVVMQGVLHIVSQALLSQDGTPVGFTLHGNLADAFAATVDGAQSFVAVGADGIPAECNESEPCLPAFWTLTFRLVPQGPGSRSSLFFDLTVIPQYDANGTLLSACLVGQDGCEPVNELE